MRANRGLHDVHDDAAEIDQYPFGGLLAFDAVDPPARGLTFSCTLLASALAWRVESALAMTILSNSDVSFTTFRTVKSRALMSSSASTAVLTIRSTLINLVQVFGANIVENGIG